MAFIPANTVETFSPSRFEAEGEITLRGKKIRYRSICEDNIIYNSAGKPIGSVFSYTYLRTDVKDPQQRPVIFVFNGGPGCSCVWLHVGMFGPYRVKYDDPVNPPAHPPFDIEVNPYCLLDDCDIVLLDPVGTGYGILLDPEAGSSFYSVRNDAEVTCDFIESWISRYGRWQSRKYLCGESYGTTRACAVAGIGSGNSEKRQYAMSFSGVILVGGNITVFPKGDPTEQSVVALPTMAVTNLYHNKFCDETPEKVIEQAWDFAVNDYLPALFRGNSLKGRSRRAIKEKLSYYTRMSDKYLEEHFLRIDRRDFTWNVVADRGLETGFYDSRFTQPMHTVRTGQFDSVADEASMGKFSPSFIGAMNGPIKDKLGITFNRPHEGVSFDCTAAWTHGDTTRSTSEYLSAAMRRIREMQVMFVNGYYDVAGILGNVRYHVNQSGLAEERTFVNIYPSGHMAYLGDDSLSLLSEDVRRMVTGKLKNHK
jgi:carboxypeptidase C (cathepsin A)